VLFSFVGAALFCLSILRFGLLAALATVAVVRLPTFFPIATELSAWYAQRFVLDLVLIVAIASWAARVSMAGQPLFRARFLGE